MTGSVAVEGRGERREGRGSYSTDAMCLKAFGCLP